MLKPILFFILFLHPFYLVRFLEISAIGLVVFKLLSLAVIIAGLFGVGWFLFEVKEHIQKKKLAEPSIWFKLPLGVVSCVIIFKFLIPLLSVKI